VIDVENHAAIGGVYATRPLCFWKHEALPARRLLNRFRVLHVVRQECELPAAWENVRECELCKENCELMLTLHSESAAYGDYDCSPL